jgi:hypothetical protein
MVQPNHGGAAAAFYLDDEDLLEIRSLSGPIKHIGPYKSKNAEMR